MCSVACVRACMSVVRAYIAKWLEHQPANQNVVGSILGVATLVVLLFP